MRGGMWSRLTGSAPSASLVAVRGIQRVAGWVACAVAVAVLGPGLAAAGRLAPWHGKPSVWHLRWTEVLSGNVDGLYQSGPYVFVLQDPHGDDGVLLDAKTGTQTALSPSAHGCSVGYLGVAIGGGNLMFPCGNRTGPTPYPTVVELYSLSAGTWRTFDYSKDQEKICGDNYSTLCWFTPVRVGTNWLQFALYGGAGARGPGGDTGFGFENLTTGAWRQTGWRGREMPGLNATTRLDLNSPVLLVRVCSPIQLPEHGRLMQSGLSPISIFGRYTMVGYRYSHAQSARTYLERCGRRSPRRLSRYQAFFGLGNDHVLVWGHGKPKFDGMFLASGRKFVFSPPTAAPNGYGLAITPGDVFANAYNAPPYDGSGVWEATLPHGA